MTEAQFQKQVIDLAHLYSWRVAHFRPARTEQGWRTPVQADGAGFPDLVLIRPPELLFVELKSDRGRLSAAQTRWLQDLGAVERALAVAGIAGRVEVRVWCPADFDEVNARLARGRQRAVAA